MLELARLATIWALDELPTLNVPPDPAFSGVYTIGNKVFGVVFELSHRYVVRSHVKPDRARVFAALKYGKYVVRDVPETAVIGNCSVCVDDADDQAAVSAAVGVAKVWAVAVRPFRLFRMPLKPDPLTSTDRPEQGTRFTSPTRVISIFDAVVVEVQGRVSLTGRWLIAVPVIMKNSVRIRNVDFIFLVCDPKSDGRFGGCVRIEADSK